MKILADENIMKKICDLLKDYGHDVKSINTKNKGITDQEVLQIALNERRTILSSDQKFCKSLKGKDHYGVLFLNTDVCYQRDTLKKFLEKHIPTNITDIVVTLTKDKYSLCDHKKKYVLPKIKEYSLN